jgi:hypothetical protein
MIGAAALIGFILTIPAANWLIVTLAPSRSGSD